MRVNVTRFHINQGERDSLTQCPVALAILDIGRGVYRAEVNERKITVYKKYYADMYNTPDKVKEFIQNFDTNKTKDILPFRFEILNFVRSPIASLDNFLFV